MTVDHIVYGVEDLEAGMRSWQYGWE